MSDETVAPPNKQEQKSARAREAICEAAIRCLVQLGYSETSINRVVEQAGVSKGALQHHFPSKEDLMADTASYLLRRPLRYADRAKTRAPRSSREALRDIWKRMTHTDPYLALLEILVAARTDKVLQKRIAGELQVSIKEIDTHFARLHGDLSSEGLAKLKRLMSANRCFMRGLLIEQQYGVSKAEQDAVLETWLDLVCPSLESVS